jgi:hypothetical protein
MPDTGGVKRAGAPNFNLSAGHRNRKGRMLLMEGKFTLPWPEYAVMHELAEAFKKEEYAVFVPASRQQKDIDLLLFNTKNHKTLTIQVKSSRSYQMGREREEQGLGYAIWLNNFADKIDGAGADYYIIYGLYPRKGSTGAESWNDLFLCYSTEEIRAFLKRVRQKKDPQKPDKFFGFEFNDTGTVVTTGRGILTETGALAYEDASACLLHKKVAEMKKRLA